MEKMTLTVREVAEALGVSVGLVYEAAQRRELPFLRIGKRLVMPKAALEKVLEGQLVEDLGPGVTGMAFEAESHNIGAGGVHD